MLNGFGYALFGVPSRDLETTWHDVTEITKKAGQSPLLNERPIQTVTAAVNASLSFNFVLFLNVLIFTGKRSTFQWNLQTEIRQNSIVYRRKNLAHCEAQKDGAWKVISTQLIISAKNLIHFSPRKTNTGGPTFEMRWATAEDFMELKVMPRMLLDHLPDNVFRTLTRILEEQKTHNGSMLSLQEI